MKIAVLAGDGIGPEIIAQAHRVLEVLRRDGLKLELEAAPYGGAGYDARSASASRLSALVGSKADAAGSRRGLALSGAPGE